MNHAVTDIVSALDTRHQNLLHVVYASLEKLAGWWFDAIIVAEPVIAKYFPSDKVTSSVIFPIAGSFSRQPDEAQRQNHSDP